MYSLWSEKIQFRSVSDGIDDVNNTDKQMFIYPNPAEQTTTIVINDVMGMVEFVVTDINGKTIVTERIECNGILEKVINLEQWTSGVYFVKIHNDLFTAAQKLIVR